LNVRLVAVIAAALFIVPASASASVVSLDPGAPDAPPRITYTASSGEANKLNVTVAGATAQVDDPGAGTVTPGTNCAAVTPKKVTCTNPNGNTIQILLATLGDGADTATVAGAGSSLDGGPGNDTLTGGASQDFLKGGGGTDTLKGNAGNDTLSDGDTSGSANKDTLDGGADSDTVDYAARTAAVTVDLVDPAGDGETGENDVLTGIENIGGGSGNDVLRGTDVANSIGGGAGNDEIDGRGGDDQLTGADGNDTLIGGAGVDDIEGGNGDDTLRLDNPPGVYDRLTLCSAGNDTIVGVTASPFIELGCETGDFGFGYVAPLKPKAFNTTSVTLKIPCPDAFKKSGACKGSVVVEPKGAYSKSASYRKSHRYGVAKFSISKSSARVKITLNSAGRKELKKSAFKLQFQVNLKETATGTKRKFEWTSYVVKAFF
jgi:hypothetical protein